MALESIHGSGNSKPNSSDMHIRRRRRSKSRKIRKGVHNYCKFGLSVKMEMGCFILLASRRIMALLHSL